MTMTDEEYAQSMKDSAILDQCCNCKAWTWDGVCHKASDGEPVVNCIRKEVGNVLIKSRV